MQCRADPCQSSPCHAGLLLSCVKPAPPRPQDFANHNAFHLLERYRPQLACFNGGWAGYAVKPPLNCLFYGDGRTWPASICMLSSAHALSGLPWLCTYPTHLPSRSPYWPPTLPPSDDIQVRVWVFVL